MRIIKATQQLIIEDGLLVELSQPLDHTLQIQGRKFVKPDKTKVFSYWGWLPCQFTDYEEIILLVTEYLLTN